MRNRSQGRRRIARAPANDRDGADASLTGLEARRDSPAESRDVAGVVAPPPLIYLAGLGIGFGLEAVLGPGSLSGIVQWVLGPLLALLGTALLGTFVTSFHRADTAVRPDRPSTSLVTGGPYRLTRNPGYLGMTLVSGGIALMADAPWALIGVALAVVIVDRGVIAREERYLQGKFGEEYLSYRARVRRWL